jgi:hypothetical protein
VILSVGQRAEELFARPVTPASQDLDLKSYGLKDVLAEQRDQGICLPISCVLAGVGPMGCPVSDRVGSTPRPLGGTRPCSQHRTPAESTVEPIPGVGCSFKLTGLVGLTVGHLCTRQKVVLAARLLRSR